MKKPGKEAIKQILGQLPFTAELYWLIRQGGKQINSRFSLRHLQTALPEITQQINQLPSSPGKGKKVFIFATLHYWIEHAALLGLALTGQGHRVTLGFLPYGDWQNPLTKFDLRRQNVYAKRILGLASPTMETLSLLGLRNTHQPLPEAVSAAINMVSRYDYQYTLQQEEVDTNSDLYNLRLERNTLAGQAAMEWLQNGKPDVLIVPNGSIQELGVVYHTARYLKIPSVTYEFDNQRQRIWLSKNDEVMRQNTDEIWKARQNSSLNEEQLDRLRGLFLARKNGETWENFSRRWQDLPTNGGERIRAALKLDQRPIALLPTNVLGDSLTLGRQMFCRTMSEWISRTVQYFAGRQDAQLIIRVHPGEVLTHGLSMVDVVHQVTPRLPENIRLITPKDRTNTYDLIEIADVGLVYTTTVGLEMAMVGKPVIVAGQTHYRERGFTFDPVSFWEYFKMLGNLLDKPLQNRLSRTQTERAWNYAYRFFFELPQPFPWHLVRMWDDYRTHPMDTVLSPEGQKEFGKTFQHLVGEPYHWDEME